MTKTYITAGSIALASFATAQSLFVEDPNDGQTESLPIQYSVTASIGYDDHFTSDTTSEEASSSGYATVALGANYVNASPQTTWKVGAYLSANKYFDDDSSGSGVYYSARLNLDLNHRLTERTRFVSSNYFTYGIEPNYSNTFSSNINSEHTFYSLDNAIGHRWTSRLATYTGVRVSAVDYHGGNRDEDRQSYGIYNNFRYSLNQTTTLTANLSYNKTDASGSAGDATDLTGSLGFERRLSSNSYLTANAGATYRDVDGAGRSDYTNPYITAALNTNVNSQLSLRTFIRYGIENYGTSQGIITYDTNQALRVGVTANYTVSPKLSLNAGVNYIQYDYTDGRNVATNTSVADADRSLINPNVGFTYRVNDNTSINGSYNYTDSSSSFSDGTDFSRNRVQLGVTRVF